MKYTLKMRLLAIMLVVLTLCTVACANDSGNNDIPSETTPVADNTPSTDAPTEGSSTDPAETTAAEIKPDLPDVDYTGKTITFLEREIQIGDNIDVYFNEIYADLSLAETVSNAVYNRNEAIINKYGITIESLRVWDKEISSTFTNAADSGDKICDVLHANGTTTMPLANKGYLRDMNNIDYVNYDNPWWMGMVMDTSSISGKNAFAIGDTNIQAFTAVSAMYFNKQLIEDLGLENIYDQVKAGKWTLDMLYEYCRAGVAELDGDNVMTTEDRYGLLFNAYVWQPIYYGFGKAIVQKDADDVPFIDLQDEKIFTPLSKAIDFLADDEVNICTSWASVGVQEDYFQNGHSLFYVQLMYSALEMRKGETEFGIIPMPKYDESQDDYYHYIHNKSSYTSVPKINEDLEMTGIILEDMAYYSYKLVRPDFFDVLLDGKVARDEESTEMLDYIYKNVYVCLLRPLDAVGLSTDSNIRAFIINKSGSSAMASAFKKVENMWKKTLNSLATSFEEKMDE